MALIAYQTSAFAYQGSGQFAYQGDAVGPTPVTWPMGGAGWPVDWQGKRRKNTWADMPNAHLEHILKKVVSEYYGEIIDEAPEVAAEAKAIIKPYVIGKTKGIPAVSNVDWSAFKQDLEAVKELYALWLKRVSDDDEDDAEWLMMS